jgi:hypothetical protein
MDTQRDDYAEPVSSALCPAWLRESAAVFLLLALVETDLVMRAWLNTVSPPSTADEPLQSNW